MRTIKIIYAAEELEQVRKIFPNAKQFDTQTDAQRVIGHETKITNFLSRLLSWLRLG